MCGYINKYIYIYKPKCISSFSVQDTPKSNLGSSSLRKSQALIPLFFLFLLKVNTNLLKAIYYSYLKYFPQKKKNDWTKYFERRAGQEEGNLDAEAERMTFPMMSHDI